jgi:hypothetical protein
MSCPPMPLPDPVFIEDPALALNGTAIVLVSSGVPGAAALHFGPLCCNMNEIIDFNTDEPC